jgi:Holliday junction resolvase RusA-like endonuclease
MIILTIDGPPIAWKRAAPNWKTRSMYDTQKKEKEQVRWQLRQQYKENTLTMPLEVIIVCYFPIPESISKVKRSQMLSNMIHHNQDPDGDNLDGFYWDCMQGVIFKNDNQIFDHRTTKLYGLKGKTVISVIPHSSCIYKGSPVLDDDFIS